MSIKEDTIKIVPDKIFFFLENTKQEELFSLIFNEISKNNYELLKPLTTMPIQKSNYLYNLKNKSNYIKRLYTLIKIYSKEDEEIYYLIDKEERYNSEQYKTLYKEVIKIADQNMSIYTKVDEWYHIDDFLNQKIVNIIFSNTKSPLYKFESVIYRKIDIACSNSHKAKDALCQDYIMRRLKDSNYIDLLNYDSKYIPIKQPLEDLKRRETNRENRNKILKTIINDWAEKEDILYNIKNNFPKHQSNFYEYLLKKSKDNSMINKKLSDWIRQSSYINKVINSRIIDFMNLHKETKPLRETKAILYDFFNDGINSNNNLYIMRYEDSLKLTIRLDEIIQELQCNHKKKNKDFYLIDSYNLTLDNIYLKFINNQSNQYLSNLYAYKVSLTIKELIQKINKFQLTDKEKIFLKPYYNQNLTNNQIIEQINQNKKIVIQNLASIEKRIENILIAEGFIAEKRGKKCQEVSIGNKPIGANMIKDDESDEEINYENDSHHSDDESIDEEINYEDYSYNIDDEIIEDKDIIVANNIINEELIHKSLLTNKKSDLTIMTQDEIENLKNENIVIWKFYKSTKENLEIHEEKILNKIIDNIYTKSIKDKKIRKRITTLEHNIVRRYIEYFDNFYQISELQDKLISSFISETNIVVREELKKKICKQKLIINKLTKELIELICNYKKIVNPKKITMKEFGVDMEKNILFQQIPKKSKIDILLIEKFIKMILTLESSKRKIPNNFYSVYNKHQKIKSKQEAEKKFFTQLKESTIYQLLKEQKNEFSK